MKKLMALLLAMLLCFALVACDTPEESSSSSSSDSSSSAECDIRPNGEEQMYFYYRDSYQEMLSVKHKESVELVTTYAKYLSIKEGRPFPNGFRGSTILESVFNESYVFYRVRIDDNGLPFMGYYGIGMDNDGYWMKGAYIDEYDIEYYNSDGSLRREKALQDTPFQEQDSQASSSEEMYKVIYEIIIIPKKDVPFVIDESKPIVVYDTIYNSKITN